MYRSFNARALGLSLSARATIDLAASTGFEGVDLLVRDLIDAGDDPSDLRARMDGLGLRGGAWPLPVAWRGDESRFRHDLERLPRLADAAAVLGLPRTATWVMPETPPGEGDGDSRGRSAAFELHVDRLVTLSRVLAERGTRLGLEVIGVASFRSGRGPALFDRMEGGPFERLMEEVVAESPGVGLLIDAFHLFAAGDRLGPIVARWGIGRVVWVHVADCPATFRGEKATLLDGDRGLPGEHGAIDVAAFLRELASLGYDGPVTVEPLAGCRSLQGLDPEAVARKVATTLDATWPRLSG